MGFFSGISSFISRNVKSIGKDAVRIGAQIANAPILGNFIQNLVPGGSILASSLQNMRDAGGGFNFANALPQAPPPETVMDIINPASPLNYAIKQSPVTNSLTIKEFGTAVLGGAVQGAGNAIVGVKEVQTAQSMIATSTITAWIKTNALIIIAVVFGLFFVSRLSIQNSTSRFRR